MTLILDQEMKMKVAIVANQTVKDPEIDTEHVQWLKLVQ